jgi:outer membrane protein assembly factor BamB
MNVSPDDARYQIALRTAAVAGIFSLLVAALLLYDVGRRTLKDPLEDAQLQSLKGALAAQPENKDLRARIQNLDQQLREEYFRQRLFSTIGAGLLLGGIAVAAIAARTAATLRRKLPRPQPQAVPVDPDISTVYLGRCAVAVLALVVLGAAGGLILSSQTRLPADAKELEALLAVKPVESTGKARSAPKPAAKTTGKTDTPVKKETPAKTRNVVAESPISELERPVPTKKPTPKKESLSPSAETPPSDEEIAKAWPSFRGPGGAGVSAYANIPTTWNAAKGENIVWKTPVPLPGNNSPVVWGNRVFLSGATEKERKVFCFDATGGKLLWQKDVPSTPESTAKVPKINRDTGFAAPTVATDGRRVFAIFANGDIAGFDIDGNLAWARSLGIPENVYGHSASLVTYKDLVIVQFDQGQAKGNKSKLLALDAASGKTVWEVPREVPNSWPSPIIVKAAGRDQLITAADPWVIAYNPADGKEELWRCKFLKQDVGPSPVYCDGIVYVANQFPAIAAIRADGSGDVTKTHILWRGEDGLPDTCSPLATKEHLYVLASEGTLTCYDAKQGDNLWTMDFPGVNFTTSPSLVGKLLYLIDNDGKARVIEPAADAGKIVSEPELGQKCVASPAFQDGRMYIRTYVESGEKPGQSEPPKREDCLFCIGKN